jgi:hypothetical protein
MHSTLATVQGMEGREGLMKTDVTVVVPTIPPRSKDLLPRALQSIWTQELPAAAVSVAVDIEHRGAWVTRQLALDMVRTTWASFLDDDDAYDTMHLRRLMEYAAETDADYCYSYFTPVGMGDPLGHFGKVFNPDEPHHTTMTVMVKTELAQAVGFTAPEPEHVVSGEDWRFILGCVKAGAKIVHLPERTWFWHFHPYAVSGGNTSGQPHNW